MLVLARGGDPLEPPLAQGPVPSSRGLGRAARGGDPPEPPAGSRPRSFVTRPWPCCPGGDPPGTPAGSRPRSFVTRPWPCCPGGDPPGTPAASRPCCPWASPRNPFVARGGQVLSRIRRELRCGVDGAKPGRDGPPLVRAVGDRGGWPTVDDPGHAEQEGGDSRGALHPRGARLQQ